MIKLYSEKKKYRIPVAIYSLINIVLIIVMMSLSIINGIDVSVITTNIIGGVIGITYCLGFFFTLEKIKSYKVN